MYRITRAGVPTQFNTNPDGNTATNDADVVTAKWLNDVQEELAAIITDPSGGNAALNTADQTQLLTAVKAMVSANSFAPGTRVVFAQNTAPSGWVIDVTNNDAMLRVVNVNGGTQGAGGTGGYGTGGTVSPTIMNVVPTHSHTFADSASSTSVAGGHTHADTFGATTDSINHSHSYTDIFYSENSSYSGIAPSEAVPSGLGNQAFTDSDNVGYYKTKNTSAFAHNHAVTITGAITAVAGHSHTVAVSGTTANNVGGANWTPKYINVIIAVKS